MKIAGQRIRDLRRTRAMSLETVAARTDLSIGFISQIERGLSSPSLRVLATLADVMGVGIAGFFRRQGERQRHAERHCHPQASASPAATRIGSAIRPVTPGPSCSG